MTLSRRAFFTGLATLIAAPAIVRAESLMKLAPMQMLRPLGWDLAVGGERTVLALQKSVDVLYGSMYVQPVWTATVSEFLIPLDEYSERIFAPMRNRLAQNVADAVMHGQSVARYDLAGMRRIPLSELLIEARGHQFT